MGRLAGRPRTAKSRLAGHGKIGRQGEGGGGQRLTAKSADLRFDGVECLLELGGDRPCGVEVEFGEHFAHLLPLGLSVALLVWCGVAERVQEFQLVGPDVLAHPYP